MARSAVNRMLLSSEIPEHFQGEELRLAGEIARLKQQLETLTAFLEERLGALPSAGASQTTT